MPSKYPMELLKVFAYLLLLARSGAGPVSVHRASRRTVSITSCWTPWPTTSGIMRPEPRARRSSLRRTSRVSGDALRPEEVWILEKGEDGLVEDSSGRRRPNREQLGRRESSRSWTLEKNGISEFSEYFEAR